MKIQRKTVLKKLFPLCLAAVLAAMPPVSGFAAPEGDPIAAAPEPDPVSAPAARYRGDVDNDGKTTAADARLALRASVGLEAYAPRSLPFVCADYDDDGVISSSDARRILRAAVALEPPGESVDPAAEERGPENGSALSGLSVSREERREDAAAGDGLTAAVASALYEQYRSEVPDGLLHKESYRLLAEETSVGAQGEEKTVYLIVYHMSYSMMYAEPKEVNGGITPAAITFSVNGDGAYVLKEYWTPGAGPRYGRDIRAKFPAAAAEEALHAEACAAELRNDNLRQAAEYLDRL